MHGAPIPMKKTKENETSPETNQTEVSDAAENKENQVNQQDKIDLLNNITLDIRVEIGRSKIKISEVLNLSKGMILELDQEANEPLNIFANDKIIAKGSIITSNGRFCIKIL